MNLFTHGDILHGLVMVMEKLVKDSKNSDVAFY